MIQTARSGALERSRRGPLAMMVVGTVAALAVVVGCGQGKPAPATTAGSPPTATGQPFSLAAGEGPREFAGLANVCRVSDKLLSGGVPQGDDGFSSLKRLGVCTVISVDGARPDVERARKFALRYVHLPIGYDGVPREQGLRI